MSRAWYDDPRRPIDPPDEDLADDDASDAMADREEHWRDAPWGD